MDRFAHFGRRLPRTISMLTAIVLLGSMVSSPVTSALAVMPVAASPTFSPGVTCDVTVDDDTRLQLAVASSVDDSVICITADIALSNTLILDDTTVTLRGRPIGDDSIVLTVEQSFIHLQATATSPGDDTLVIDTLTLRGRGTSPGGGIAADDYAIYIRNSTLSENNAGAADGGAIYAINGDVTIDDSTAFTGNTAGGLSGGGAIYARNGDVTINGNSTFTDDTAGLGGGAIYAIDGNVTINGNSTFTRNKATGFEGRGGAIYAIDGDVTINGNSTFTDNKATGFDSGGGAIYAFNGDVTINGNSTFTRNTAVFGGAIYTGAPGVPTSGGDVTTSGGTFTNNTAGNSGGAVFAYNGDVTIDDSTAFTNNDVTGAGGLGGAIYAESNISTDDSSNVTTSGGAFTNNDAGGGGGAIYASNGDVTIDDTASTTDFTDNTARGFGGSGGAIFARGDVTTNGGTFKGNIAGPNSGPYGGEGGGAIYAGRSVNIDDSTSFAYNTSRGSGGAIYAGLGRVSINDTASFANNAASGDGGAIHARDGDVVNNDVITFANNTAGGGGGAIYADDTVTTSGGTFTGNAADGLTLGGGAIYAHTGRVIVDDTASATNFVGNTANRGYGGAIRAGAGGVTTSRGTFTSNTANYNAGGVFGYGGAICAVPPISVTNSTFFRNSAVFGGAALSDNSSISLRYTTAVDDSTNLGGVFASVGSLTILGSVIAPAAGRSACSASADDSSYNSFVTDSSCGSGDDTVVVTSRADIGLSGPLVTDDSTGAQVLIPDDTSILINAAPADLVAGVTTDQLQATRGRSPDDSTTVGAVQVLPLVITGQPASTTVAAGATATFTVDGEPGVGTTVNYQWQTRANDGASWVDSPGEIAPTLTLAPVSAGQNGLQVRALVSDIRDDSLSSSVATLTVTSSPGPGPAVAPGAPRNPKAVPGNEDAEVTWLAPVSSGTYPITSYEVVNDINGTICRLTVGPNTALSCAMTGLTNGTSYRFRVRALSSAGAGEWSPWSNAVTPSAPPTPRTLVITGTRDGAKVRIRGTSTGLSGSVASPWVRLAGQVGYKQGVNLRPIAANGSFDWSRTSLRKTYVYFTADGIVSNRVIFPSAR